MSSKSTLDDLVRLEMNAREFGFDWTSKEMIVEQAISECKEILDAIRDKEPPIRLQEEIGDLLHTTISLCLFSGFDVRDTISLVHDKFNKRMQILKELAQKNGLQDLKGQSFDNMLELWKQVKEQEKSL